MTLIPGSMLGPYRIVELLGAGGMGVVYRAHDERLQRDVAIKVLPPGLLANDDARRRFRREALALAQLNHPHIASIHDVGEQDGADYLVMECVREDSLATRLQAGPLTVVTALSLGSEVASALAEAHDRGIVHRDLKPANIIITPQGHAKVLDFGLVKLLGPSDSAQSQTASGLRGAVGTPLYMSPEQAFGESVDQRTDLWSLGVVLYESLSGNTPFRGPSDMALLRSISQDPPIPLREVRADLPASVQRIVNRALTKDLAGRYQSAAQVTADVDAARAELHGDQPGRVQRAWRVARSVAVLATLVVIAIVAASVWQFRRLRHREWVRTEAIPEIDSLLDADQPLSAFLVLRRAESYMPADSAVRAAAPRAARVVAVTSSPAGAQVDIQNYVPGDTSWYHLGVTPIAAVQIPAGYLRWRLSRPGVAPVVLAPVTGDTMRFALDKLAQAPPGMVPVPASNFEAFIDLIGWAGPYALPAFAIDRYEVTNRQYQAFVDSGGYRRPEFWREPFVDGGRNLNWNDAMSRFRDRSGRAGPSTWEGGHYPEGQADYPVAGLSWYEAGAYAAFAGKALPTVAQRYQVAPPELMRFLVKASNIRGTSMASVGKFAGVGPYGTYDMAGNIREWAINAFGADRRFILGGAWSSQTYLAAEPEALPPWDRSPLNGVRCVRNFTPVPRGSEAPIKGLERDFAHETPVSDEVFRAYRAMYAYDPTPLHARVDSVVQDAPDWREERISFDAAYNNQRMAAYLFLPKRVRPPYQAVIFFPSARVVGLHDSRRLGDTVYFDYVVQSGRAVIYPVYQDTYERTIHMTQPGAAQDMELTVQRYKDMARSLDYLATRPDIDTSKVAYLGVSMGSAFGVIYATLAQDRLRTAVLLDGGFFLDKAPPGGDQIDFAPRLHIPVLMVNGRYDFSFSLERSQNPLFAMLGTRASEKHHVVMETPHDVSAQRATLVPEVVGWLDKYLGPVTP
jgi:formylglycine-generating enzyme required for sulfatase activity/dienelactone hydrolase